jgi:hypothetical protein
MSFKHSIKGYRNVEVIGLNKDLDKNYTAKNSRMAGNIEEVKELGKQMEQLRTNAELEEENKVPDPIQEKESSRSTR